MKGMEDQAFLEATHTGPALAPSGGSVVFSEPFGLDVALGGRDRRRARGQTKTVENSYATSEIPDPLFQSRPSVNSPFVPPSFAIVANR